ncbi:MAG: hypothetical protein HUJ29_11720 [Gammaproteobacteria bacterium]|nr:hypothetical protein [Gammaproteobacteria bacterium]
MKIHSLLLISLWFVASLAWANTDLVKEAGLPTVGSERLQQLAAHSDWEVRRAVAGNRRTPVELLRQLATDPDRRIRITVATNLSTPPALHMLLAADADKQVRSVVSRFEYVPAEALDQLANDPDPEIRVEVAGNWNTAEATLKRLLQDEFESVRRRAEQELAKRAEESGS